MSVTRPLVLAACLAVLGTLSATAGAQNAARGQGLYSSFPYGCSDCHGGSDPEERPREEQAVRRRQIGDRLAEHPARHQQRRGRQQRDDVAAEAVLRPERRSPTTTCRTSRRTCRACSAARRPPPPTGSVSAPASASFGCVTVGSASLQSVTVSVSTAAVAFTGGSLSGANAGDFSIASNTCTGSVSPGTCQVGVSFQPSSAGGEVGVAADRQRRGQQDGDAVRHRRIGRRQRRPAVGRGRAYRSPIPASARKRARPS